MTHDELEGRLSAQREILTCLLAAAISGDRGVIETMLKDEDNVLDGNEDPGSLPTTAYAFEAARAHEVRTIVDAAKARAAAG
jgi:hypothetical protein